MAFFNYLPTKLKKSFTGIVTPVAVLLAIAAGAFELRVTAFSPTRTPVTGASELKTVQHGESRQNQLSSPTKNQVHNATSSVIKLNTALRLLWQKPSNEISNLTSAADNQAVYVPMLQGAVTALAITDGSVLWRAEVGGEITANLACDERAVFVASQTPFETGGSKTRSVVRALSVKSGLTLWTLELERNAARLSVTPDGLLIFSNDGVQSVTKVDGKPLWQIKIPQTVIDVVPLPPGRSPSYDGKVLILTRERVYTVTPNAAASGSPILEQLYHTKREGLTAVAGDERFLFVATQSGRVAAIDRDSQRELWDTRIRAGIGFITLADHRLIIIGLDNFVYAYAAEGGGRAWKRRLESRATVRPLVANGYVVVSPLVGNYCVVLNAESGRVENLIFVGSEETVASTPLINQRGLLVITRQDVNFFSAVGNEGSKASAK